MTESSAPEGLKGLRIFVVEDEAIIAMMLEDILVSLGCVVVGVAGTVAQGLAGVERGADLIDAAVLDVNIGGEMVFPVADALMARNAPFIFATGYGRTGVTERYPDIAVLSKPYVVSALAQALVEATEASRRS